jgi:hypothetical protein
MEKKYIAIFWILGFIVGSESVIIWYQLNPPIYYPPWREELQVLSVTFPTSSPAVISVINTSPNAETVSSVAIDDVAQTSVSYGGSFDSSHSLHKGLIGTITIYSWTWTSGCKYTFAVITTSGNKYTYTTTALGTPAYTPAPVPAPAPPPPHTHDVTVNYVIPSKTVVGQGYAANIRVRVSSNGYAENTDLTIIADPYPFVQGDEIVISTQNVSLNRYGQIGQSVEITVIWNTTNWQSRDYRLSAFVSPVTGETNTLDNTRIFGIVRVTIPGDVTGDCLVSNLDAFQINLYWQQRSPTAPAYVDINNDDVINIKDASIIGVNWLKHA